MDLNAGATLALRALPVAAALLLACLAPAAGAQPTPPVSTGCGGAAPTIVGTAGNDAINGTTGDDVIVGGDGNDVIRGRGGNDKLCGNAGNDLLLDEAGDDYLSGGSGVDQIGGGAGDDQLSGGVGNDVLGGHGGNDRLRGGAGNDRVAGNSGNDTLAGDAGDDRLEGGASVDFCVKSSSDTLISCESTEFSFTKFDPNVHGFHFVNSFSSQIIVTIPQVTVAGYKFGGRINLGQYGYGLCGGMSYAAADTFFAKGVAPPDTSPPANGTQLYRYILDRQLDSLLPNKAAMFRRFVAWQFLPVGDRPGVTGLKKRSRREFKRKVRPKLRDGRPAPLGMVFVDGKQVPWKNHQVLAIGYFIRGDDVVVGVYDPNYIEDDGITWLHLKRRVQTYDIDGSDRVEKSPGVKKARFRGYFATPYTAKRPYWVP